MSAERWYIDTSALFKTLVLEAESQAFIAWLADKEPVATCELTRVEAIRAVRIAEPDALPRVRESLNKLVLIRLDDDIYETAATLDPPSLRSLDAIHLAAALSVGPDLAGVVTYDGRMATGARSLGLRVESPGSPASGG